MLFSNILQVVTVLLAVLTLVWHQTRSIDKLRKEVRGDHHRLLKLQAKATRQARKANDRLRREFTSANDRLRREFTSAHDKLEGRVMSAHDKLEGSVIANGRKLDRIEGFLGIGMPAPAAADAPGAQFGVTPSQSQASAPEDGDSADD